MSKKKAKEKTHNKYLRKLKEEKNRKEGVIIEKELLAEKTKQDQERNKKHNQQKEREKKTSKETIKKERINQIITPYFDRIVSRLGGNKQLAKDFVLEELDAAFVGNSDSKFFVINSGFEKFEYLGAINRGIKAVEDGPQVVMNQIRLELAAKHGISYCSKVLLSIIDRTMQIYALGKYKNIENNISSIIGEKSPPDKNVENLNELLQNYSDMLYKPKLFGTDSLSTQFLSVARTIDKPSEELSDHIKFMTLISIAGKRVKTAFIPEKILKVINTDLEIVSTVDIKFWKEALQVLSKVEKRQKTFYRVIELGRQVGDINGACAINVAPAIYNAFNLLFLEYPNKSDIELVAKDLNIPFDDCSVVTGSVSGSILGYQYKDWIFKHTGIAPQRVKTLY